MRGGLVPSCMESDALREAGRLARGFVGSVEALPGLHAFAVVVEMPDGETRGVTKMAVADAEGTDPEMEVALMKCVLARACALLVLHLGEDGAARVAQQALRSGAALALAAKEVSK